MLTDEGYAPVFFEPRPLANLELRDELSSLMPLIDMKVGKERWTSSSNSNFGMTL